MNKNYKKYVPFTDHISKEKLREYWDEILEKFGYSKNINVCELPENILHKCYDIIVGRIENHE